MADMYEVILDIMAFTAAGVGAWIILASFKNSSRRLPLSMLISRVEMPPDEKKLLREKLINQYGEGNTGSWSQQWDQPTGEGR